MQNVMLLKNKSKIEIKILGENKKWERKEWETWVANGFLGYIEIFAGAMSEMHNKYQGKIFVKQNAECSLNCTYWHLGTLLSKRLFW